MDVQNDRGPGAGDAVTPVTDEAALDAIVGESGAVVLFLHDPSCPISRAASREVRRSGVTMRLVDVSRNHALPQAIDRRTGFRHESPQVVVLAGGRPAWTASHGAIGANVVRRAVERAGEHA